MDRISGANYITSGGLRMFQDRNQAAGIFGTFFNALWCNGVQEELMAILAAADVVPNAATFNQVLTALGVLFGGGGSVAQSGWQKLPGGLIMQWKTGALATGHNDVIVLPVTFPAHYFVGVASEADASGWNSPPNPTIYGITPNNLSSVLVSAAQVYSGSGPAYVPTAYNLLVIGN